VSGSTLIPVVHITASLARRQYAWAVWASERVGLEIKLC